MSSGGSVYVIGYAVALVITGELTGYSVGGVFGIDKGITIGEVYFGYTFRVGDFETVDCSDDCDVKQPVPILLEWLYWGE